MRALLIAAVVGCTGEQVQSSTVDASGETGACVDVTGNVLKNGSFELWTGSSPTDWVVDGLTPVRHDTSAQHCTSWLEGARIGAASLSQVVRFSPALPANTSIRAAVMVRLLAGAPTDKINIEIVTDDREMTGGTAHTFNTDGTWQEISVEHTIAAATTSARIFISSSASTKQTIAFDRAWMTTRIF